MNPQNGKDTKGQGLSWSNPAKQQPSPAPASPQKNEKAESKSAAQPPMQSNAAKITGWLAAGIVAGVVIAWGATSVYKNHGTSTSTVTENSANSSATTTEGLGQGSDPSLMIESPQKAGSSVAIMKAIVSEPTWIVVYESRDGKPGNVLGAGLFFPDHQQGSVELLRNTIAGQTYFVTKHSDDGDHKFSLKNDPILTENGQAMWVSFTAN